MPELPEVQRVVEQLRAGVVGTRITDVEVHRASVVHGGRSRAALLAGDTLTKVLRHGKQLAMIGKSGRCICLHLGMSGSLQYRATSESQAPHDKHDHVIWCLAGGGRLVFHDPRRFGGLWTFNRLDDLRHIRWSRLGPDALHITPRCLHHQLSQTARCLKAVLLDQAILAGLGNIYVDELLFACELHPGVRAEKLSLTMTIKLIQKMRAILKRAITSGGTTIRNYVGMDNRSGSYQYSLKAYGRANQPCYRCNHLLRITLLAGRTTVFCPQCQQWCKG